MIFKRGDKCPYARTKTLPGVRGGHAGHGSGVALSGLRAARGVGGWQRASSARVRRPCFGGAPRQSIRVWNVATGQEMLFFQDAWMLPGDEPPIADAYYSVQAGLIAGDRWLFWRERSGRICVNPLPALADIDREEAATGNAR
jgi:hypothetical protein